MATLPLPLHFLTLPKELRLKVYSYLPLSTHKHVLHDPTFQHPSLPTSQRPSITLATTSFNTSILRVSRQVHAESLPCLAQHFKDLRAEPLRFTIDSLSLRTFIGCGDSNVLSHILARCLTRPLINRSNPAPYLAVEKILWYKLSSSFPYHNDIFIWPTAEHAAIDAFITHCASYIISRHPRTLVATVEQDPDETLESSVSSLFEAFCSGGWLKIMDLAELGIGEFTWNPVGFGEGWSGRKKEIGGVKHTCRGRGKIKMGVIGNREAMAKS